MQPASRNFSSPSPISLQTPNLKSLVKFLKPKHPNPRFSQLPRGKLSELRIWRCMTASSLLHRIGCWNIIPRSFPLYPLGFSSRSGNRSEYRACISKRIQDVLQFITSPSGGTYPKRCLLFGIPQPMCPNGRCSCCSVIAERLNENF